MWGGIACAAAVLVAGQRLGRLSRVDRALRLPTLGSAAGRGVGGGVDLEIGSDGFFDHMGSSAHFKACDGGSVRFKL